MTLSNDTSQLLSRETEPGFGRAPNVPGEEGITRRPPQGPGYPNNYCLDVEVETQIDLTGGLAVDTPVVQRALVENDFDVTRVKADAD